MIADPAPSITKAASKQTYYTIRFLVDRDRVADAYRAYGYFRWVDDMLDSDSGPAAGLAEPSIGQGNKGGASNRRVFLERQKSLLGGCYRGEFPRDANVQENMLVELIRHDREKNSGLQSYLRHMMMVMDFDAKRRGRVISQAELHEYTRALAIAVTDNMHHFIGHDDFAPRDETRYLAVAAAHIVHMIRDSYDDVRSGYFNIPREVLDANRIGPQDVDSAGYRAWVKSRVQLAREYFTAGRSYLARVQNNRCRLAGFAYTARFEWLLDTIEEEGYCPRAQYPERKSLGTRMRVGWIALSSMIDLRGAGVMPQPAIPRPLGKQ